MKVKKFSVLALVLVLMLAFVGCSQQPSGSGEVDEEDNTVEFPSRPIEWIVHSGAGGGSDIAARTSSLLIQDIIGTNIVVANHTGGDGAVQMDYLQSQPADGHTWALMTAAQFGTMIRSNVDYTLEDWIPVVNMQVDPRWLAKRADDDRFADINDVIAYAKENPGELSVAGMGFGTDYMVISTFMEEEGIEVNYVPHDSTGDAVVAMLGKHTDLLMGSIVSFIDYVEVGDIVPLLLFWEEKAEKFPDVPAAGDDLGHESAYLATIRGVFVRAGTPDEVVQKIHDAVYEAMQTQDYKDFEEATLQDLVVGYRNTADYKELCEEYYAIFEKMLKKLGEI
ncbi:MAG: tripartite tricarboxylate transporter substrate binding protein [bacterium]|jgi:putative tricarboxylic transport membrane protein